MMVLLVNHSLIRPRDIIMSDSDAPPERPKYRAGRKPTAVKIYTVNHESRYLVVENVPALGLSKELLELFSLYGTIEEYRYLDDYPCEKFTDVYWIKFQSLNEARVAKKKVDDHSFFSSYLRVRYGPEYESIEDTRQKLQDRRNVVAIKTREHNENKGVDYQHNQEPPIPGVDYQYNQEPPIPGIDYESTSFAATSYPLKFTQPYDSQTSTTLSIRQRLKEVSTVSTTTLPQNNESNTQLISSEKVSTISEPRKRRRI
ncbi:9827_t:CDS:2 [Scutellospora calospora]|uniref:9827_t:CDS:1 n=1 Tax=Scutellospora calospora TaxID=85575 RepID=A0ACA9MQD4_9GLOM|nr:9827_t:CDS:2 [Scutellospora calospora]